MSTPAPKMKNMKIILWGYSFRRLFNKPVDGIGKTSLIYRYLKKQNPTEHPELFGHSDPPSFKITTKDWHYEIFPSEPLIRSEGALRLASLACPQTELFLMCYTPAYQNSFDAVTPGGFFWKANDRWYNDPKVKEIRPPAILVECGTDRRDDPTSLEKWHSPQYPNTQFVPEKDIKWALGAMGEGAVFHKTSAKLDQGVDELFDRIIPEVVEAHLARVRQNNPKFNGNLRKQSRCILL